jgi:hypothetical protein
MSDFNVRFGDYTFTGIAKGGVRELHGPERDIVISRTVGTRGVKILASTDEAKVISVSGILERDTANLLVGASREFTTAMGRKAQPLTFTPTDGDGEYVYDGAWVTNWNECIAPKENDFSDKVEYQVVFICPKGFARSTTQTTHTITGIDETPYNTTITIEGDANPEPIIAITFVDASTITDLIVTNQTTNETIQLLDLDLVDGDIIYIDTELGQVRLNTTVIRYSGVFPSFNVGENNIQVAVSADTSGITEQQLSYDSEYSLYGARMISQKITAVGTGVRTAIEALIKQFTTQVLSLYDDFNDGSIDSAKWGVSGGVTETGGLLRLSGTSASASTDGKTDGDPLTQEVEWTQIRDSGTDAAGGTMRTRLTNGTDYIEIAHLLDVSDMIIRLGGHFGSGDGARWTASSGVVNIKQVGSDIEIRVGGVLRQTLTGKSFQSNMHLIHELSTTNTHTMRIDNVKVSQTITANSDITIEIQTNSAGEPSGTPVTNGTLTIPASTIGTDNFSAIIAAFATAPSLTDATVYHIVISQSGGDTNNYYLLKTNSTSGYAGGNILTSIDGGANWTDVSGEDLYFRVYGDVPASFDLTLAISWFKSLFNVG